MKFSLKQLFSIIDGRLSTDIDDVYSSLDTLTGESLMTHHLGTAMTFVKSKSPACLQEATSDIEAVKAKVGNDLESCMKEIDTAYSNKTYEIGKLTEQELEGFGDYMVENSVFKGMK